MRPDELTAPPRNLCTNAFAPSFSAADGELLDLVQRQTFGFFWEGAHPQSGLARDRQKTTGDPDNDLVAIGGSGFGIMAIVVAVERGWVSRDEAVARLGTMLSCLEKTSRYHGMFPHFINGRTAETIPFSRKDDGGDVVETAFLFQGLLCARQYFDRAATRERDLCRRIDRLWREAEWDWYRRDGGANLYWHWSPRQGWAMNRKITGWNEGLLAYVLAAGSPDHAIDPEVYHQGFASGPGFRNGRSYHGIELPLGMDRGGPLFIAHYSFCGLDPRGLMDRHADYWKQNVRHTRINYEHCIANPHGYVGYGRDCWGLTSSHGPKGYVAHAPGKDTGVITPSAALSSFPYAPDEAMRALRYFKTKPRRPVTSLGLCGSEKRRLGLKQRRHLRLWFSKSCTQPITKLTVHFGGSYLHEHVGAMLRPPHLLLLHHALGNQ